MSLNEHDDRRIPPVKRRVAITGLGAVTPLGLTMQSTWQGILQGASSAGPIQRFDASNFPTTFAYEVKNFSFPTNLVSEHEAAFLSTAGYYGVQAAHEALVQADLVIGADGKSRVDPLRLAVCLGVGMCSPDFSWYDEVFIPSLWRDASLPANVRFFPNQVSSVVARMAGAQGGISTVHSACASSGHSIGEAYELIAYGDADVVVTGGTDSMIHPYYLTGFSLLGALSKRNESPASALRPFDKDRDGFVLGEGACVFVLEDFAHAVQRGATILGEICGFGVTASAYRVTDLHPAGTGPIEAMEMAVHEAGIAAAEVGYINAHGTSTLLNDRIEALAISKVFGGGASQPKVSSTKSMTGHLIAGAGAIELAVCVQALAAQVLPPSIHVFAKDAECCVELTPSEATGANFDYALSNSVGFGGSNTALVARRVPQ